MVPFNNIEESLKILEEIKSSKELIGIQVFTRHLGKSIAEDEFRPILKINYFGIDHVLYGTDAPFGILPNGATKEIEEAIDMLPITNKDKEKIYNKNIDKLLLTKYIL